MGRSGGEGPARERCNGENPHTQQSNQRVAHRARLLRLEQRQHRRPPQACPRGTRLPGGSVAPTNRADRAAGLPCRAPAGPLPVNPLARPMLWSSLRLPESAVAENPWLASLVPVKFAIFIMEVRLIGLQARSIAMTSASRDRKTAGKEKTVMPPASIWVTVLSAVVLSSRGGSNGMRLPRTRGEP